MVDKNWADGKDLQPLEVVLTRDELKQFVTFVSEARPTGDFEIRLGLSRRDVEKVKARLGIETPDQARDFYKDVFAVAEARQDAFYQEERQKASNAREVAEKRLKSYESDKADAARERRKKARSLLDVNAIKEEDVKRQKNFEEQQLGEYDVEPSEWRLPEDTTPDQFQHLVETRGWQFVSTMFATSKKDIVAELKRLGLNINFDLVPR